VKQEQARRPKSDETPRRIGDSHPSGPRALGCGPAAAADVQVSASVLPQGRISETTQVRLVIRIDGRRSRREHSEAPAMKNLQIAGGLRPRAIRRFVRERADRQLESLSLTYF